MTDTKLNKTFRDYLRCEFEARARTIPRYSLNSFAKDLGLAPSRLSEVLSEKQGISRTVAMRIAGLIGLSPVETEKFCDLVDAEHARSAQNRIAATLRLKEREFADSFASIQDDIFNAISDWYHFAILQLFDLPSFRDDPRWIARAVGISRGEAEGALARLLRLKLLERRPDGLKRVRDFVSSSDGVPSSAIRKLHNQMLGKASIALAIQPIENRNFSNNILSLNKKDLSAAMDMLKKFRRRFTVEVSKRSSNPDSVYCLSMQFFELTQNMENR